MSVVSSKFLNQYYGNKVIKEMLLSTTENIRNNIYNLLDRKNYSDLAVIFRYFVDNGNVLRFEKIENLHIKFYFCPLKKRITGYNAIMIDNFKNSKTCSIINYYKNIFHKKRSHYCLAPQIAKILKEIYIAKTL